MKEVDKEIARAVVDDDEKLNEIFDEIDQLQKLVNLHKTKLNKKIKK